MLFIIARNLLRGRTGRALIAIREHPLAAATMGVDAAFYKWLTFGVSAMYSGIAGVLLSAYVSPDSFPVLLSIKFLVGSVVGGIVLISGVFIGALFIEGGARRHLRYVADRVDVSHAEGGHPSSKCGLGNSTSPKMHGRNYLATQRGTAKNFAGGPLSESQGTARVPGKLVTFGDLDF